jgi:signal transduction histidine kinase
MMEIKNRRRKIIIHGLQIQLILTILGLVFGISLILLISLFVIVKSNLADLSVPEELIQKAMQNSMWPVAVIAIVLFIGSGWSIVMITLKIYGPLYRLRNYIGEMSKGKFTDELEFRKGDAIEGLQEIYNDLRYSLGKTLNYDYGAMVKIFSELQEILDNMYKTKNYDQQLYESLQNVCAKLAKALDITSDAIASEKNQ